MMMERQAEGIHEHNLKSFQRKKDSHQEFTVHKKGNLIRCMDIQIYKCMLIPPSCFMQGFSVNIIISHSLILYKDFNFSKLKNKIPKNV